MSAAQLREWEAYYCLEPFGNPWMQTALLAALTANANRDTEARPEPFEIQDFLPVREPEIEVVYEQMEQEQKPADEPPWKMWKKMFQMMADASRSATLADANQSATLADANPHPASERDIPDLPPNP